MLKRKNMQIAIQIFGYLTVVGGIIIGILLYYHKQSPAVWVTFFTIMSLTLSLCLGWQQNINKNNPPKKPDQTGQSKKDLTLLYLFENDFNNLLRSGETRTVEFKTGEKVSIKSKLYLDFEAQNEFIGFFIPNTPGTFNICIDLAEHYKIALELKNKTMVEMSGPGIQPVNSSELKFSGRIFIYHEYPLLESQKRELLTLYEQHSLSPQFRGPEYLFKKKEIQKNTNHTINQTG